MSQAGSEHPQGAGEEEMMESFGPLLINKLEVSRIALFVLTKGSG